MVSADSFVDYIAADVPDCPNMVIRRAVTLAAQDFFRETGLWVEECDVTNSTPGDPNVELEIPSNTIIGAVKDLAVNGRHVEPITPEDVNDSDWMTRAVPGTAVRGYWVSGTRSIRLYPILTEAAQIAAFVAVVPSETCISFGDIAQQYFQAIVHGAKWKLQAAPGQPYSNADLAVYNNKEFHRITGDAKIRARRSGTAQLRVNLRGVT